jgi:hypothetical protein
MRCGQGRLLPKPLSPYEGAMRNVQVVRSCGFTTEYTNISHGVSLTEGQYVYKETFHV